MSLRHLTPLFCPFPIEDFALLQVRHLTPLVYCRGFSCLTIPPPHPVFFCPGVVDFPSTIFSFLRARHLTPVFFLSRRGRFPFKDFSFLRVRHLTPFPCECVFVVAVAFFALVRRDFGSRRIAGLALARRDRASSRSSRFPCDSATYYADWCTMAAQLDQIAA